MKIILNDNAGSPNFTQALGELVEGAHTVSVAVSYMQVTGWELFRQQTGALNLDGMRLVCTDQLGVTHPEAVKRAISKGVQVRNFSGDVIYHPKIFLAQDADLNPTRFLIGSANLSSSAFTNSVEGGVLGSDAATLVTLSGWFDDLFDHRAEPFTPENLVAMEARWRRAAAWRAKNRLLVRREIANVPGAAEPVTIEDVDAIEDVFSTIRLPIGLLNLDHGGNNIRNIAAARNVLANPAGASDKQRSEMKLLGFMLHGQLTELGALAAAAQDEAEFSLIWCRWLQATSDVNLRAINPKLLITKSVFPQFWSLKEEVREYFLANARNPNDRRLMQTIELLCNAKDIVQDFSLEDMKTLSDLLDNPVSIPAIIRHEIMEYFDNKGTRSWSVADRRTIPMAWREASNV